MSNSSRLSMLVQTAHEQNDLHSAIDAYNEWQQSNCYHPSYQRIYDAHTMQYRKVLIPCGTCYHCMETKINEWVTRMYAHLEDFKNVYFITLTYRSFTSVKDVERLIMNKLAQAVWHKDAYNSTKHLCYNPCLLVKKHYQDFLKRLRKKTGIKDLSYVLCGEYGTKYGRPHFHAILFTNERLTKADIVSAWSVALFRYDSGIWSYKTNQKYNGTPYFFPIGRVDFNDLVANGTLNTSAKVHVDDHYFNAAQCFSYVCKYVCKRDNPNLNRVKIAWHSMYQRKKFAKLFNNEISADIAESYLMQHGFTYERAQNILTNNKTKIYYEKNVFVPQPELYQENLETEKSVVTAGHQFVVQLFPSDYLQFRDFYPPFVEFSRGTPIGSVYATNHLQEFTHGIYNKPILQKQGFVVPSYFRSKAKNYVYGLRTMRNTIKGTSFVYGGLPDFARLLETCYNTGDQLPFTVPLWRSCEDPRTLLRDDAHTLRDLHTGERCVVLPSERVACYKYNRHLRDYEKTRDIPLKDWLYYWLSHLHFEYEYYNRDLQKSKDNLRLRDRALSLVTDLGADPDGLRDSFVAAQELYLHKKQKIYEDLHKSVE